MLSSQYECVFLKQSKLPSTKQHEVARPMSEHTTKQIDWTHCWMLTICLSDLTVTQVACEPASLPGTEPHIFVKVADILPGSDQFMPTKPTHSSLQVFHANGLVGLLINLPEHIPQDLHQSVQILI